LTEWTHSGNITTSEPERAAFLKRTAAFLLGLALFSYTDAWSQRVAKYGADFLAGGVGARALGMGGAFVGLADDATSAYWNPAGLSTLDRPEFAYMHAERFAGIVSFDFAGAAWPLSEKSTFGVSFYRSGVNDIKNTLDAWDEARNQPKANPEDFITTFSAADYAFYFGYGRRVSDRMTVGFTGKIIRRTIGDFADAWGYSMDAGALYQAGAWQFGLTLQDITTMLQSWSVNRESLTNIRDVFGDDLPEGGTELVLPVARLGSAYTWKSERDRLVLALDMDLAFDGYKANALNIGDMSIHPRVGAEYLLRDRLAIRLGLSRIQTTERDGLDITPTIGAGFIINALQFDYGFGDFGGLVSELGYSHRISVSYRLDRSRSRRPE